MSDTLAATCNALHTSLKEGILTIRLRAPGQGNRLSPEMVFALDDLWRRVAVESAVRVVVLQGSETDFSLGLDTQAFSQLLQNDMPRARTALQALHQARARVLPLLPQPVIGVVHGACHGAALRLIEGCDIVLAAENAEFMLTADDAPLLAQHPDAAAGPEWLDASHLAACAPQGRRLSAREAAEYGWVTHCHPQSTLDSQVLELVQALAQKDALALQFTKETVAHVGSMSWDAAVSYTAAKFAEIKARQAGTDSTRASAVQSFLAGKSKPGLGG